MRCGFHVFNGQSVGNREVALWVLSELVPLVFERVFVKIKLEERRHFSYPKEIDVQAGQDLELYCHQRSHYPVTGLAFIDWEREFDI